MGQLWQSVLWPFRAAVVVLGHTAVICLLILVFWVVEQLVGALWGEADPLLFGVVPLKYLFHAIDLALIIVFGFYGIIEAARTLRGKHGMNP